MEYLWAICTLLVGNAESMFKYYLNTELIKQSLSVVPFYAFLCLLVYFLTPILREVVEYLRTPARCEQFYRSLREKYDLGTPGILSERETQSVESFILSAVKEKEALEAEVTRLNRELDKYAISSSGLKSALENKASELKRLKAELEIANGKLYNLERKS